MIALYWHQNGTDDCIKNGRLLQDDGLNAMIFIMLMTDARAKENDEFNNNDKRGWPGDTFSMYPWGSRLWLLKREKLTSKTIQRAQDYTKEALLPLLKSDVKSYTVTTSRTSRDRLRLNITIKHMHGEKREYALTLHWNSHNTDEMTDGI